MSWDAQMNLWRVVLGVAIALEPWWITSPPKGRMGECRTYLLLGVNMNEYKEMRILNLHLVVAKFSIAWRRSA